MVNQRCKWHRGRALGGTSVINGMLYVRGNKEDFDYWSRTGNDGWSFEEVLPYFKKSQHQMDPYLAKDKRFHNVGGPQPVSFPRYKTRTSDAFVKAGQHLGYAANRVS